MDKRLQDALDEVEREITALTPEYALVRSKMMGLSAHRLAIVQHAAMGETDHDTFRAMTLTDAVQEVLSKPMSVKQVQDVLSGSGRDDSPQSVSATLSKLATSGQLVRRAYGVYAPLPSTADPWTGAEVAVQADA